MRKFYSILAFIILSINVNAQTTELGDITGTWSFPKVYNYDEQVSWYFDLSGTGFEDAEELYIWIWSPSEPDANNWENSSEFAKLTYEGNFVWKFDLTPTEYFNLSASDIAASAGFWLRLKNKDGTRMSKVTNLPYTTFSSFYTSDELIRAYPENPILDQPLSILFNSNLASNFAGATSVHMHSGLNNWSILQEYQSWAPAVVEKTKLKDLGNGFYKMDLIPSEYYETPPNFVMENMNFLFVKDDWAATTPEQILYAADVEPPPPAVFSFFPLKISHKDILGIRRVNNEVGINKLFYKITADTISLQGEFEGNITLIAGFIDLASALEGLVALESIHIVVKDNRDNLIIETDIPLIKLD
ncbi:MAG: hypothetical protein ACI9Z4_000488 [Polaribacter sp.]|jgi:hypothetical protein